MDIEETAKFLIDTFGPEVHFVSTPHAREGKRQFEYVPKNADEFKKFIEAAPLNILLGCGFRKWDTMNSCIAENQGKPKSEIFEIPIINAKPGDEPYKVDVGRGDAPTKLLAEDEDIILFPGEWFDAIPEGFVTTGLSGESKPWKKSEEDDDIRFGCLAYGIRRKILAKGAVDVK